MKVWVSALSQARGEREGGRERGEERGKTEEEERNILISLLL